MVKKLLIRGADINYRNKFGKTALHYAVENDMPE
jgi:ankyrin repeat protein